MFKHLADVGIIQYMLVSGRLLIQLFRDFYFKRDITYPGIDLFLRIVLNFQP